MITGHFDITTRGGRDLSEGGVLVVLAVGKNHHWGVDRVVASRGEGQDAVTY